LLERCGVKRLNYTATTVEPIKHGGVHMWGMEREMKKTARDVSFVVKTRRTVSEYFRWRGIERMRQYSVFRGKRMEHVVATRDASHCWTGMHFE
jgi:hypothetical protein